jgi:hypothetical protein
MGKVTSNASDELSQGSHFTLMVVGCDSLAALRRSLDQLVSGGGCGVGWGGGGEGVR